MLGEGAAPGTAAQVDGEFSQRKHIPSGITAPKPAQVRQTLDTGVFQLEHWVVSLTASRISEHTVF